jgi:hypothetical protein
MCDVEIWVIKNCGTQIKWCKGCKVSLWFKMHQNSLVHFSKYSQLMNISLSQCLELQRLEHIWRKGGRLKVRVLPWSSETEVCSLEKKKIRQDACNGKCFGEAYH